MAEEDWDHREDPRDPTAQPDVASAGAQRRRGRARRRDLRTSHPLARLAAFGTLLASAGVVYLLVTSVPGVGGADRELDPVPTSVPQGGEPRTNRLAPGTPSLEAYAEHAALLWAARDDATRESLREALGADSEPQAGLWWTLGTAAVLYGTVFDSWWDDTGRSRFIRIGGDSGRSDSRLGRLGRAMARGEDGDGFFQSGAGGTLDQQLRNLVRAEMLQPGTNADGEIVGSVGRICARSQRSVPETTDREAVRQWALAQASSGRLRTGESQLCGAYASILGDLTGATG